MTELYKVASVVDEYKRKRDKKLEANIKEFIDGPKCKPCHLTLADVKNLKIGDVLDVAIFYDNARYDLEPVDAMKPSYSYLDACDLQNMFKNNRFTVTYLGSYIWKIDDMHSFVRDMPVHIDRKTLTTNWAPMHFWARNVADRLTDADAEQFPETIRVGCDGPMMLWSKLAEIDTDFRY
jgi:hypothetical protein